MPNSSFVEPAHVIAQKYLEKRGFQYWDFMQQMGDDIQVITHKEALERTNLDPSWAKDGVYALWLAYPDCADYGTARILNPTRRMNAKMLAPKGVRPPVYVPRDIEPGDRLYICESALKALTLTSRGYPAIAGNGVNGVFTNAGFAPNFPTGLVENAKEVVILFDSDIEDNKNVKVAGQKLALGLINVWPHLHILQKTLPKPPELVEGDNWGVDDFVAYYGDEDFGRWMEGHDEDPFDLGQRGRHLTELSVRYAVTRAPLVGIVCFESGKIYKPQEFHTLEAPRVFTVEGSKGGVTKKYASKEYLEWPGRNEVKECRYVPGAAPGFSGDLFNTWVDDGVEPVDGSVQPFLDMVMNAIPRNDDAWLMLKMWAWGLQNRGQRWEKVLMLISAQQSTGKTTLTRILHKCYGNRNAVSIDPDTLVGSFSGQYSERELVRMDEVMKIDAKAYARVERMVTDDRLDVNVKFGGQYEIDNYVNLVMTSNDAGCIPLKDMERRLFAVEVTPEVYYPQGSPYWDEFNAWLEEDDGYGKIRHWLESMDLEDYNPKFLPPVNPMKRQMMEAGRDDMTNWCLDLKESPATVMQSKRKYFTPDEVFAAYSLGMDLPDGQARALKNRLTQVMNKVGFKKANAGKPVKVDKVGKRFWNVCGDEEASAAEIRADYETDSGLMGRLTVFTSSKY